MHSECTTGLIASRLSSTLDLAYAQCIRTLNACIVLRYGLLSSYNNSFPSQYPLTCFLETLLMIIALVILVGPNMADIWQASRASPLLSAQTTQPITTPSILMPYQHRNVLRLL